MKYLITGGAGYVGSHVVYECLDAGHEVVVVDDLSTGVKENLPLDDVRFVRGDVGDSELLGRLLREEDVDAVMHFAASSVVPESVREPLGYYENNAVKSRSLIEACVEAGVEQFIFSSTSSVYGVLEDVPVTEEQRPAPTNPYGRSKWMTELMLEDVCRATDLRYAALRYFNVAGGDPKGRTGESIPESTHLIKVACETALGERPYIEVYGDDYTTPDGTCIRDYIHVTDVARAHLAALEYLRAGHDSDVFNCGYGHGYSVLEIIEAVKEVSGVDFEVRRAGRREGDPPRLVGDPTKACELLGWRPEFDDISYIIETALAWERREA